MIVTPKGFEPLVFVIGPMGEGKGKVGGVDISKHIPNIKEALDIANKRLAADGLPRVRTNSPVDATAHDINEFALRGIDTCDIAIADISDRSPNVFYELAFLHSLGIPVITIDSEDAQQLSPIPWYARTRINNTLVNFGVPEIADCLYSDLKYLLGERVDPSVFSNPISRIYNGIPLVDISAATGLAAGHFTNFLRRILSTENGPFAYQGDQPSPLKHLVIVYPDNVQDLAELEVAFKARIKSTQKQIVFANRQRPLVYNEYKDCVVDFPNPISVLITSPRYKRLTQILKNEEGEADEMLIKIEKRWIETYFNTLRQHEKDEDNIFKKKMKFMTLEEIGSM